jgi:hypothetical protein
LEKCRCGVLLRNVGKDAFTHVTSVGTHVFTEPKRSVPAEYINGLS